MSEKNKRDVNNSVYRDDEQENNQIDSQDEEKVSKIAEFSVLSKEEIEEGLKKLTAKLREKLAPLKQLSKQDPGLANRIMSRSEDIARRSYFEAVMNDDSSEINKIIDDSVLEGIHRLIEVDGGHGTIATPKINKNFNRTAGIQIMDNIFNKNDKDNQKSSVVTNLLSPKTNIFAKPIDFEKKSKGMKDEAKQAVDESARKAIRKSKDGKESCLISTIIETEMQYKGTPQEELMKKKMVCLAIACGNEEYALDLAKKYELDTIRIDKDGTEILDKDEALKLYKKEEIKETLKSFGIEDLDSEEAKKYIAMLEQDSTLTYEGLSNEFETTYKYKGNSHQDGSALDENEMEKEVEKDTRRTFFYNQIINDNENFEENMTAWVSGNVESAVKFLEEFQSGNMDVEANFIKNVERLKNIITKVQLKESVSQDNKNFKEDVYNIISGNPSAAQDFLKDFLTQDNQSIQDYQNKVMIMQETIKQVEKQKLKEAFDKGDADFEKDITELVNINPGIAQEFVQEFLEDGTKTVADYGGKIAFLQQSIVQANEKKSPLKEEKKSEVLDADKADTSALKKSVAFLGKTQENVGTVLEDDEPSL